MKSVLVLTSRFPFPLEKGDKLRIYNQIKGLSLNNKVHLVAIHHRPVTEAQTAALTPFCESIHVYIIPGYARAFTLAATMFYGTPLQVGLFYKRSIHKKIAALIKKINPDAIYCHLIRMSEYVKDQQHIRKTLDYMDVFSKGMERRRDAGKNMFSKAAFTFEYKRLLRYEREVFDRFDECVIISGQDRDEIPHPQRSRIAVIPNGVDFNDFYPMDVPKKYELLFSGNMGYPPNIESAHYAATQILPLLKQKYPNIRLLIAGINAPERIKALKSENIIIIEEWKFISDAFAQSKIMLAPMLISIGLQNKILQAMAMKLPTIASSLANNAIMAQENEAILIADTPAQYAQHICMLLDDPLKMKELAANAYAFVNHHYSWDIHNTALEKIVMGGAGER